MSELNELQIPAELPPVPIPSAEGTTAKNENKELLDKISKMKPDELLEFYTNSQEAVKAATQRNMETAEQRRQFEAEREYMRQDRQRLMDEKQKVFDLLTQQAQLPRPVTPMAPNLGELTPEEAFKYVYNKQTELEKQITEERKAREADRQAFLMEVQKTQAAVEYRDFLRTEIFPKYPNVSGRDLDAWITEHPNIQFVPGQQEQVIRGAAQEIQGKWDKTVETAAQELLKRKAAQADAALVVEGQPFGAIPGGKAMTELDEREQVEILKKDLAKAGFPT